MTDDMASISEVSFMKTFVRRGLLGGVAAAIFTLTAAAFAADVPQTLTHQGRLYDANGVAVTGAKTLVFSIYDAVDAAAPIWSEKITVTFDEGYFSTNLGDISPLKNIFDGSVRYLGIQVDADPEMSPRVAVNSVPYALVAGNAIGAITPTQHFDQRAAGDRRGGQVGGRSDGARRADGSARAGGRRWLDGSGGSDGRGRRGRADGSAGLAG